MIFFLYILPKCSLQAHNYKQNRKVVTRKRGKESHGNMVCCCSEDGNRIKIRAEWLEREKNQSPFQEIPGCITSTLLNIFNICSNITVYFNQFVNPSGRPSCFNQRHHCQLVLFSDQRLDFMVAILEALKIQNAHQFENPTQKLIC